MGLFRCDAVRTGAAVRAGYGRYGFGCYWSDLVWQDFCKGGVLSGLTRLVKAVKARKGLLGKGPV
jgi:hypothetical protein